MLQRRLTRLEKKLNVPPEDRHTSAGELQKAEETTVEGVRIYSRASSLHLDRAGRAVDKSAVNPLQVKVDLVSLLWPPKVTTVLLKGSVEVSKPLCTISH